MDVFDFDADVDVIDDEETEEAKIVVKFVKNVDGNGSYFDEVVVDDDDGC
jgi:hypothetical protein